MSSERPAPAHIYLHIGTMKTGTSYVQQVLGRNSEALERDGAIFANSGSTARAAILDLLAKQPELAMDGPWSHFAEMCRAHPGSRVIVSNELISFVDAKRAAEIIESLRPNPVTVIITARDLARLLPSAWQNKVKHGRAWPFDRYVDSVISDDGPKGAARSFWHHHDLPEILDRWIAAVGVDNVVVIPVPGSNAAPDALWQRFAEVTGLGPTGYDLTQDRKSNLSLGYVETELLRQVNHRLRERGEWSRRKKSIQRTLANEVLRPDPNSPRDDLRPTLTPAQHAWSVSKSRELADQVAATGVRVHGDLDELVPAPWSAEEQEAALEAKPPEIPTMYVAVVSALVDRLVDSGGSNDPLAERSAPRGKRGQRKRRGGRQDRDDATDDGDEGEDAVAARTHDLDADDFDDDFDDLR